MRKNLLLLIMFCLIATIGAKAEVTGKLSDDGTTFTITTGAEGGVNAYFDSNPDKLNNTKITTLVVVGPMKSEPDLSRLAYNMTGKIHIKTLDLTKAVFTSNKSKDWNTGNIITTWDNLKFPGNEGSYLKSSLETIKFPKPATGTTMEIPANCMEKYNIKNVIIPCGYTKIGSQAFQLCYYLQILNIPEGVTEIGSEAFRNSVIQGIRLPNSLLTIGHDAFNTCGGLASITIPVKVTNIGSSAFNCCYGLRDVYVLATTPPTLGEGAFDRQTVMGCVGGYPAGKAGKATREDYWTPDENGQVTSKGHHYAILHYPSESIDSYTDQYFVKQYTLDGDDYLAKYPTEDQAKALNLLGQDETDAEGNVIHHAAHTSTTDWKSFTLSKAIDGAIQPIPNIAASRWYTMCFDFDLTKDQIESAFGAGTEVCRFQGVKYTNDGNNNVTATLDFSEDEYKAETTASTTITKAGYPYMIHPAAAAPDGNTEPIYYVMGITKVKGCTAKPDYGKKFCPTIDDIDEANTNTVSGYYPYGSYKFQGTLSKTTVPSDSYYLGLWNGTTDLDKTEDGHRAFFYHPATSSLKLTLPAYAATLLELGTTNYHGSNPTANAKKTGTVLGGDAVIFTSDNSTTGIENTESENSNETSAKFADKVFSISGQLVRTGSSSLEGLAKGIYIVNGKKYIVR